MHQAVTPEDFLLISGFRHLWNDANSVHPVFQFRESFDGRARVVLQQTKDQLEIGLTRHILLQQTIEDTGISA
jgi:hypothetical protein